MRCNAGLYNEKYSRFRKYSLQATYVKKIFRYIYSCISDNFSDNEIISNQAYTRFNHIYRVNEDYARG